jgi:hypothetical protein
VKLPAQISCLTETSLIWPPLICFGPGSSPQTRREDSPDSWAYGKTIFEFWLLQDKQVISLQFGKEETKPPLFRDEMVVIVKHHKGQHETSTISKFSGYVDNRSTFKCVLCFYVLGKRLFEI